MKHGDSPIRHSLYPGWSCSHNPRTLTVIACIRLIRHLETEDDVLRFCRSGLHFDPDAQRLAGAPVEVLAGLSHSRRTLQYTYPTSACWRGHCARNCERSASFCILFVESTFNDDGRGCFQTPLPSPYPAEHDRNCRSMTVCPNATIVAQTNANSIDCILRIGEPPEYVYGDCVDY
jgi:hypothetical protein